MHTLTHEDDGVGEKQEDVIDAHQSFNTYIGNFTCIESYRVGSKGWGVFLVNLHSLAPRLLSHPPDNQVEIDKIITSLRDKGTSTPVTQ